MVATLHHRTAPMTYTPGASPRRWSIAVALLLLPAAACAWQTAAPTPRPRPVIVVQPPANARFQQTMREQQVRDQLRKNQLEEQLRQNQADAMGRPHVAYPVHAARLLQADQAQHELYRVRQQDLLDRYQSAVAPPVVHAERLPAAASSSAP
jgi:hypothetical protein